MLASHRNVSYGTASSRLAHLAISRSKLPPSRASRCCSSLAAASRSLARAAPDTGPAPASYSSTRSFPSKCFAQPISLTQVDSTSTPPAPSAVRRRPSSSAARLPPYVANIDSHPLSSPVSASASAPPSLLAGRRPRSTSNQPLAARARKNLWHRTPSRHGRSAAAAPSPAG
ncbi:hypothetical protein DL771_003825 [Monosporascus sp. 5C6A]|nr:hypothetical protein DL771_003825 [Monosporascus sp. 5C6A]